MYAITIGVFDAIVILQQKKYVIFAWIFLDTLVQRKSLTLKQSSMSKAMKQWKNTFVLLCLEWYYKLF